MYHFMFIFMLIKESSRAKRAFGEGTSAKEGTTSPFTDKRKYTVLVKSFIKYFVCVDNQPIVS